MDSTKMKTKKKPEAPEVPEDVPVMAIPPYQQDTHIDMTTEIKALDAILNRMAMMVDVGRDVDTKYANSIAQIASSACEVAETVKYLKSDEVYTGTMSSQSAGSGGIIPMIFGGMYDDGDEDDEDY